MDEQNIFEKIRKSRRDTHERHNRKVTEAIADTVIRTFEDRYVHNALCSTGKLCAELYLFQLGEYWIEARWIDVPGNKISNIISKTEFKPVDVERGPHYCVLVWDSPAPMPRDEAIAKGFLNSFDAVRFAAATKEAKTVSWMRGPENDSGFDITNL